MGAGPVRARSDGSTIALAETRLASFRGGLLWLMMAGLVHLAIGPTSFLVGFSITEFIAQLSTSTKEDLLMVKKEIFEVIAYAKSNVRRIIASWEAHLPSRQSLLMSL